MSDKCFGGLTNSSKKNLENTVFNESDPYIVAKSKKTITDLGFKKELFTLSGINRLIKKIDKNQQPYNKSYYTEIYKECFEKYRIEYVFKNEYFISILKDIADNKVSLLSEFELFYETGISSIVDLLYIDENSLHAIEIKSDRDGPFRLYKQLSNYYKVFDYVSIFISEHKFPFYERFLIHNNFKEVGIILLTKNSIITVKEPVKKKLDKELLLLNINKYLNKNNIDLKEKSIDELKEIWRTLLFLKKTYDFNFINKAPRFLKYFAYYYDFLSGLKKKRILDQFV